MIEYLSFGFSYTLIFISCFLGLLFGLINWLIVYSIKPEKLPKKEDMDLDEDEELNDFGEEEGLTLK